MQLGWGFVFQKKLRLLFVTEFLLFRQNQPWVNLDNEKTFCDKVSKVKSAIWGMNTNIYKAFELILAAVGSAKMSVEEVENLTLVILSDMQIDNSCKGEWSSTTLFENIKSLFHEKGLEVCGRPYSTPNVLFWNLRKTSGFPSQTTENNVTMLSGFNPMLLNILCDKGVDELKNCTPYLLLQDLLNTKRYDNINTITNLMV